MHHMGWGAQRQRGSTTLYGASDTVLYLTPVDGVEGRVKLEVDKLKDHEEAADVFLAFEVVPGTDSGVLVKADVQRPEEGLLAEILAHVEENPEGIGPKAVAQALDADYDTVAKAMQRASGQKGLLRKAGRGIYVMRQGTA